MGFLGAQGNYQSMCICNLRPKCQPYKSLVSSGLSLGLFRVQGLGSKVQGLGCISQYCAIPTSK